jgi:serine/threonine-protein kinase
MSDQRIGTELAGYRIESRLGRGGMSVVYLAEDLRLKRRAALKVLAPELAMDTSFRERFIAESELAASLDHPNVIPIFEAGEADGVLFIAMRYVQSTDLKDLIERNGRLEPERAISIVSQVASALDAAHAQGLVHRDVKPANILIAEGQGSAGGDHVYLADFGLTKRAQQRTGLTRTGQFVGTVDYVAPEQIEGKEIDGRTDEYALACVLYECLAGDSPYPKPDETATLIAHLMDPVPSIRAVRPDLPAPLDDVLRTGMSKQKESRYADCRSFTRAASDALAIDVSSETRISPQPGATFLPAPPDPVPSSGSGTGTFEPAPAATVVAGPPPVTVPAAEAASLPPPGGAPATVEPPRAFGPSDGDSRRPTKKKGRSRWVTISAAAVIAGLVAAGLVLFLGKGDDGGSAGPGESPGGPTSAPPTTARTFEPGTVIFQDDFTDSSGGWDQVNQAKFAEGIADGSYFQEIKVTQNPQAFATAFPHVPDVRNLGDVTVTATARKVAGTGKLNAWGVACRSGGNTESYYFVIDATGDWAIEKSDGVNQPLLVHGTDPTIKRGQAANTIRADCTGGADGVRLALSVNGNEVADFTDTPEEQVPGDSPPVLTSGTVGLVTVGSKGLRVEFDDFEVKAAG